MIMIRSLKSIGVHGGTNLYYPFDVMGRSQSGHPLHQLDNQCLACIVRWHIWPKRELFLVSQVELAYFSIPMPSAPTTTPSVTLRAVEGTSIAPCPSGYVQWYTVNEDYDGWEYDGVRRIFGYLAIRRDETCFSTTWEMSAAPANRFKSYRWVVSYRGSGWVPAQFLSQAVPPLPPLVYYSGHMIDQARDRLVHVLPGDTSQDQRISREVNDILGSPSTETIPTWDHSRLDRPVSPRLWHRHPVHGTVVTSQMRKAHPTQQDVRCITYLTNYMNPHDNRFREAGVHSISVAEYERLGRAGHISVLPSVAELD